MTIAFSKTRLAIFLWPAICFISGCTSQTTPNKEMISLLAGIAATENDFHNTFAPEAKIKFCDSLLKASAVYADSATALFGMANTLLELGQEEKAITIFEDMLKRLPYWMADNSRPLIMKALAI